MSTDPNSRGEGKPPVELPPVDPPSAKFILQLFVIPFLVVIVLVCVLLLVYGLFGKLAAGSRDALEHVQIIRSGNENRRWRAAYELASLIHNEPSLAKDDQLRRDLSTLLVDELNKPANELKSETPQYLALALGAFDRLDGLEDPQPGTALGALMRALDDSAPAAVRAAASQSLSRQAAKPGHGIPANVVVPGLVATTKTTSAESPDAAVEARQHAAYALGYFDTPESRAALAEAVGDENRLVRYNAASSLARLDDLAGLPVLREMLSTKELESAFAQALKDRAGPTRTMIEAVQTEALLALGDALDRGESKLVDTLLPELEALAKGESATVAIEARSLLKKRQEQAGETSRPKS